MIDLNAKRQDIVSIATELFDKFVGIPKKIRPDNEKRTGVQILVWELSTRNLIMILIKDPSELSAFLVVEQAIRSTKLNNNLSSNYVRSSFGEYSGSISIYLNEVPGYENEEGILTVSASGLLLEENIAISLAVIKTITEVSFSQICGIINSFSYELPSWYNKKDKGYFKFLFE